MTPRTFTGRLRKHYKSARACNAKHHKESERKNNGMFHTFKAGLYPTDRRKSPALDNVVLVSTN